MQITVFKTLQFSHLQLIPKQCTLHVLPCLNKQKIFPPRSENMADGFAEHSTRGVNLVLHRGGHPIVKILKHLILFSDYLPLKK